MKFSELDLSVLKSILANKKNALEFANECDAQVFSQDLWRFTKLLNDYIKIYKEVPTQRVLSEIFANDNESLKKYIGEVFAEVDKAASNEREYKHDLKKLKDAYAERLLVELRDIVGGSDVPEIDLQKRITTIQNTIQRVKGLYKSKTFDQKTLKESVKEFRNRYIAKMNDPNFARGILTGYSFLDYQTNGLRPAELFLVAGESGSGKSMLLMNLAIQMWLQQNKMDTPTEQLKPGCNVLYFSLEMPYEQCLNRVVSRLSEVKYHGIRDGNLPQTEMDKMSEGLKFIKRYPFEFGIVDIARGATIEALELIFNDTMLRYRPDVVVVDYLGLMEYEGDMDDWLKLGKISEQLHEFARIYNVCVLSAVQLNRMAKGKDSGPGDQIGAHRIGRSALIIQNANVALQIEKRQDENMHPDMLCHLIKNRDGELVKGRLLKNFANCALLNDYATDNEVFTNADDISEAIKKMERDASDEALGDAAGPSEYPSDDSSDDSSDDT